MSGTQMTDLLEELFQKYYKIIYNHCLSMIQYQDRFTHLIDDCVQEAFVAYMLSYSKLQGHPNHVGWLCSAAHNRLRSAMRTVKKDERKAKALASTLETDVPYAESAFERWISSEETLLQLEKIYTTLTCIERKVYDSYFSDDLSLSETAEINNISGNSVRSAVERIRKRAKKGKTFFE